MLRDRINDLEIGTEGDGHPKKRVERAVALIPTNSFSTVEYGSKPETSLFTSRKRPKKTTAMAIHDILESFDGIVSGS